MVKKAVLSLFALGFSVVVAGFIVQMSDASSAEPSDAVAVRSNVNSGQTIPTNTPAIGETLPTRTPVADPGTIPTRTPHPSAGCIEFAHFIDYAAGDAPIYVRINGEEIAELNYGEVTDCINVPPGSVFIEVISVAGRTPEDSLLAAANGTVNAGGSYTAVLQGDSGVTQDDLITLVSNPPVMPSTGKASVRVVNAAPWDDVSLDTRVDLRVNNTGALVGTASFLAFGSVSNYFEVDAGVFHNWYFAPSSNTSSVVEDVPPLKFQNKEVVTIYFTGGGANRSIDSSVETNIEASFLPIIFKE